jgi:hypothetical protein
VPTSSKPNRPKPAPAGYSGTPLSKKLGIKSGMSVAVLHGPEDFKKTLGTLPEGVELHTSLRSQQVDLVIAFVKERRHLAQNFGRLVAILPSDGVLWVAWPKKASRVMTDMSDGAIREIALPTGWVDIKVCAIDATWSGLKLMLRKQLCP